MKSQYLSKKQLPDKPGVYFFLGKQKEVLYVGKATSLRSRVASYFGKDLNETRGQLIVQMVDEARAIDFRVTDSVLEAIILEADLIKKFQPRFNTKEKSDKSFNCVVITDEDFPKVLVVRQRDADNTLTNADRISKVSYLNMFGPFPNGTMLKDALKIVRKIFPYRDKCTTCPNMSSSVPSELTPAHCKPCFNRQIGLCPGVCSGEISKVEYAKTIRNISLFFSGKKKQLLSSLKKEMNVSARNRDFESAGKIKKTIFALQHIQDVSLLRNNDADKHGNNSATFRIEAYDIAHISGTNVVGSMVVVEDGIPNKSEYRKFKIKGGFGNNDVASLKEMIERRLKHSEWPFPSIIVADGGLTQLHTIVELLKARGISIPVVAVTKNERHRPEKIQGDHNVIKMYGQEILLANSEAHRFALAFHRTLRKI